MFFKNVNKSFHNAKKVTIDGIIFDSKIEGDYYLYLKTQQEKWLLTFSIQPKYLLIPKFEKNWEKFRKMDYIADFEVNYSDWRVEVVDVKGMPTEQSKIKRKIFDYKYPDIKLSWLVKYQWQRIDYFSNEKRKSANRKANKNK